MWLNLLLVQLFRAALGTYSDLGKEDQEADLATGANMELMFLELRICQGLMTKIVPRTRWGQV